MCTKAAERKLDESELVLTASDGWVTMELESRAADVRLTPYVFSRYLAALDDHDDDHRTHHFQGLLDLLAPLSEEHSVYNNVTFARAWAACSWSSSAPGVLRRALANLILVQAKKRPITVSSVGGSPSAFTSTYLHRFTRRLELLLQNHHHHRDAAINRPPPLPPPPPTPSVVSWTNPSQGYSGSVWGGLHLDALLRPDTDLVFWEFSINDWFPEHATSTTLHLNDHGPSWEPVRRRWHRQAFEVFLRRALSFNPRVIIGLVLLWQPCARKCWPRCPGQDEEFVDVVREVAAHYPHVPFFGVDFNKLSQTLGMPREVVFNDCHHPTQEMHAVIGDAMFGSVLNALACSGTAGGNGLGGGGGGGGGSADDADVAPRLRVRRRQLQHQCAPWLPRDNAEWNLLGRRNAKFSKLFKSLLPAVVPPAVSFGPPPRTPPRPSSAEQLLALILDPTHHVQAFTHYYDDKGIVFPAVIALQGDTAGSNSDDSAAIPTLAGAGSAAGIATHQQHLHVFGKARADRVDRKIAVDIPSCAPSKSEDAPDAEPGLRYDWLPGRGRNSGGTPQPPLRFVGLNLRGPGGAIETGTEWEADVPVTVTANGLVLQRLTPRQLDDAGAAILTRGLLDPQCWFAVHPSDAPKLAAAVAAAGGPRLVVKVCMGAEDGGPSTRQGKEKEKNKKPGGDTTATLASLVFV